jgi:tetratricopeptide (TPR) repeat protein
LAELALEAGRKYVLYPENTPRKQMKKDKIFKPLTFEVLDKVENSIKNENIKRLVRSESLNRIKFPVRIQTKLEILTQVPNKRKILKRTSIPNLFDFEAFKAEKGYEKSEWFVEDSNFYNREKEWTRDIWNEWFDEVIPKLDGSGGRNSENRFTNDNKLSIRKAANVSQMSLKNVNEQDDDEDDEETKKNRILKSPTPYDTFDQVNLDQIEPKLIKSLENEIEVLSKRIETKTTCFDLARRGAIYRKLGFIKLALDDLNKALQMEKRFIDAYWQRHLIYLVQDKKKEAIEDLDSILKLNRMHAGAYLSRLVN